MVIFQIITVLLTIYIQNEKKNFIDVNEISL